MHKQESAPALLGPYSRWFAQHPVREPVREPVFSGILAAGLVPIFAALISRSPTAGIVNVENRDTVPQHRISVTRWRMSSFGNPLPFA